MGQYRTGTATFSTASVYVNGVGTEWLSNVSAGDLIKPLNSRVWAVVQSVISDTQIQLPSVWGGDSVSGAQYVIHQDFTPGLSLPYPVPGDVDTQDVFRKSMLILDSALSGGNTQVSLKDPIIDGHVLTNTTITLPAITLGGNVTSTGNPSLNLGSGALTAGATSVTTLTASGLLSGNSAQFTGAVAPASGAGIEVLYSGGGKIQAYDRTGGAFVPLVLDGSTVGLNIAGALRLGIDAAGLVSMSNGLAVTGALSTTKTGADNLVIITGGVGNAKGISLDDTAGTPTGGQIYSVDNDLRFFTNTAGSIVEKVRIVPALISLYTNTSVTGALSATTTIKSGGYTVGTLPAGAQGEQAYVTDATAPTYLGALTGGGAVKCPVFYNGAAWVSH